VEKMGALGVLVLYFSLFKEMSVLNSQDIVFCKC
jgi:hypothetical protein